MPMTYLKVFIILSVLRIVLCDNTYRITNENTFSSFVSDVNSGTNYLGTTVYLDADLSLSSYSSLNPIGINSTYQFRGAFDGQGHVISNLKINMSLQFVGLFGYSTGLTIKNIILDSSCSVMSSYSSSSYNPFVGGIIGRCETSSNSCNIENCVNMGNVTFSGSITNYNLFLGGIAGYFYSASSSYNCVIRNCVNYGSIVNSGAINDSSRGYGELGGIIGLSEGTISNYIFIQNCLNHGTIMHSGTSKYPALGGIVGVSYSYTYIENCVNAGKVSMAGTSTSGTSYIGSIVGRISDSSVTYINYCYYTNDVGFSSLYGTNSPNSPSSTAGSSTSPVSVNLSLISNLNSQTSSKGWNKWLLNSNNKTVTFKTNNNNEFSFSSQIILLPDLASGLLEFSGWYTDPYYSIPFQQSGVAQSTTLYGGWSLITVYFNTNGGGGNVPASKGVFYNSTYGDLPAPSRIGYTFDGWFLNESSTEPVTNDTNVTIPYTHTLYARWRINSYTVTFDSDNGENVDVRIFEFNSTVAYPEDPEKRGYTFSGWDNDMLNLMPDGDVIVTALWEANNYTVTFDVDGGNELDNKEISVTFDSPYGTLPSQLDKTGHTFAGWTDSLFGGNEVNSSTIVSIPNNHTLYALWTVNQYTITFVSEGMKSINFTLSYNDMIIYPNENPSKSFHKFRKWCTRDESGEEECNVTHVPDHNLTFTASFDEDSSLVTGVTTVGAFAVIIILVLIIIIVFLIRVTRKVKHKYEAVGIELDENINERNENIEKRIRQQVEATTVLVDIMKKLEESLKKADKSKGIDEVLMDLEVDCENAEDVDIIGSYRTTSASVAVASAINNEKNIIAAAEYLTLLYSSVREQEEYEKFSELYFGMKDVDDFMNNMDEKTISFGGIVSGFTSKKVAIKSLIPKNGEETTCLPSGVLFKVQNGMGYRIGKIGKDTDEILFELGGSFKIESIKEINKDKYIVVNLSFVSPMTKDEMVKLN